MNGSNRDLAVPRRFPAGLIGLAAGIGVYVAHVILYLGHVNDDAFITFRYSRFLASGLGPYFNVGEHVEGYTNFLHMLLMTGCFAVAGESAVPAAAKLVGTAAGATALVLVYSIYRELADEFPSIPGSTKWGATLAVGLVAVFPGYAVNSTSGLETTLFGMLVTLGVYLGIRGRRRGRWQGAGIAWAAAALTRPEGLAVAVVFGACTILGSIPWSRTAGEDGVDGARFRPVSIRPLILDAAVFLVAVLGHLLFRYLAYEGELLPNTYWAKAEGYRGLTPWLYVWRGALGPFFGPLGLVAGLAGWWGAGRLARLALPMAGVALFGAALPFLIGADWMPGWRFAVPYLPLLAGTLVLGWIRLLRPLLARSGYAGPTLALVAVAGLAVWHHGERRELSSLVELRAAGYETGHRTLADWIREEAAGPGDAVALMDIGIVGYYCPGQRILDITGLTDRHIAKSPGPLLYKRYDPAYVLDQKPRIVVLVLSAIGGSLESLPERDSIGTWIEIEHQIYNHPEFKTTYARTREVSGTAPWTERLAARFGAERVFPHAHPDQHYVLAAFTREGG